MLDRIRELIQARQLSPTQFADTIGVARPVVSHILGGRNKPSLEVVQKIIAAFPDVSMPWLLTGQGEMLVEAPGDASKLLSSTAPDRKAPNAVRRAVRGPGSTLAPVTSSEQAAPTSPAAVPDPGPATAPVHAPAQAAPVHVAAAPLLPPPAEAAAAMQPSTQLHALAQVPNLQPKTIRRVLIFYSDGTFTDYSPANEAM